MDGVAQNWDIHNSLQQYIQYSFPNINNNNNICFQHSEQNQTFHYKLTMLRIYKAKSSNMGSYSWSLLQSGRAKHFNERWLSISGLTIRVHAPLDANRSLFRTLWIIPAVCQISVINAYYYQLYVIRIRIKIECFQLYFVVYNDETKLLIDM